MSHPIRMDDSTADAKLDSLVSWYECMHTRARTKKESRALHVCIVVMSMTLIRHAAGIRLCYCASILPGVLQADLANSFDSD